MRLSFIIGSLLLLGCSTDTALARREQVRAANVASLTDAQLATWRSSEGVRGTTWGMTVDEVRTVRGEPVESNGQVLIYRDDVDGVPLESVYSFYQGHLAEVRSHVEPGRFPRARLVAALSQKYGAPQSEWDKAESMKQQLDADQRRRVAVALLDGALAAGGRGHWWLNASNSDELRKAWEQVDRPDHEAWWATTDSLVYCATFATDAASVTWSSKVLGRLLAKEQLSKAGLERAAASL